jgi:hypothetical protein
VISENMNILLYFAAIYQWVIKNSSTATTRSNGKGSITTNKIFTRTSLDKAFWLLFLGKRKFEEKEFETFKVITPLNVGKKFSLHAEIKASCYADLKKILSMTRSLTINRLALPKVRIDCHNAGIAAFTCHLCSINATCLIFTFDAKTGRADPCKAQSIYKSPYHSQFCERVSMY